MPPERLLMVHLGGCAPTLELHVFGDRDARAAPASTAASLGVSEAVLRAALDADGRGWTPLTESQVRALPPLGNGPAPGTAITTMALPAISGSDSNTSAGRAEGSAKPAATSSMRRARESALSEEIDDLKAELARARARISGLENLYQQACKDHQIVLSAKDAQLCRASTAASASSELSAICAALKREPDRAALTAVLRSIMDTPDFVELVDLLDNTID